MFNQVIQTINNNSRLKKYLQVGLVAALLIYLILILWPSKSYQQYEIEDIGLVGSLNFGKLNSNSLNFYNGLSFVSKNLDTGEERVLNAGLRLPVPDKLFWADDKGALLTFKSSFYYSSVENELVASGQKIDSSTKLYTWYLDFKSNKLSLVSKLPVQSSSAVYSAKDDGFYYINDESSLEYDSDSGPAFSQLFFYNISTSKSSVVAELDTIRGMKGLYTCPDKYTDSQTCLIALDSKDLKVEKLYRVNKSGELESILESKGILLPTSSINSYVTIDLDSSEQKGSIQEEGADVFGAATLLGINGESVRLGYDIGGSGFALWQGNDGKFVNLDNYLSGKTVKSKTPYYYRSGVISGQESASGRYSANLNGTNFESLFISNSGYSDSGDILMNSYEGKQMLFRPIDLSSNPELYLSDKNALAQTIESCSNGYAQGDSEYFVDSRTFRLYFADNNNLNTNIKQVSRCVSESGSSTLGYNLNIFVVDERSGRIVSD